jgi:hypothetical protein
MLLTEESQQVSEQLVFPHIPQGKRIIPNDLIRSSLFTVTNHNIKREYIKERDLFTFGNIKISYTGEELRQDDQDVWLQIIYLFSNAKDCYVDFLPYTILNHIDWPARTQYRDKLKDCINRMSATNISIYNKALNQGMTLSLVRKFAWKADNDERLKRWQVWLEPEIIKLFSGMNYSKILWEQRKKLNPLAKWLHSYYSSHAEPFPIKVATIHAATGSKTKAMKHFKPALRIALCELVQIGFLETFFIDMKNLVFVSRCKPRNLIGQASHYEQ